MRRIVAIVGSLAYIVVLMWSYILIISPQFTYEGLEAQWIGWFPITLLTLRCLVPAVLMPVSFTRPSRLIVWSIYLAAYVPSIIVAELSPKFNYISDLIQVYTLIGMLILIAATSLNPRSVTARPLDPAAFWTIVVVLVVVCYGVLLITSGGSIGSIKQLLTGSTNVYDIRSQFKKADNSEGIGIAVYAVGMLGKVLDPFLMATGILRKRWMLFVWGFFGQMLIFAVTGLKSVMVSSLFIVGIWILCRWKQYFGPGLAAGMAAAMLVAGWVDLTYKSVVSGFLTRRMVLIPGLLTSMYFEFFSRAPHTYFLNGFMRSFSDKDVISPSLQVGAYYFQDSVNSNAHLFAEGFAQAGFPGVLFLTVLTAAMMYVYDCVFKGRNVRFAAMMVTMPALSLTNTSPITTLVTHGGIVLLFLVLFNPEFRVEERVPVVVRAAKPELGPVPSAVAP